MKALSLWRPWGSAVALGYKRVETRSWDTSYRGWLAIHQTLTTPPKALRAFDRHTELGCATHAVLGDPDTLPRGALLAVALLAGTLPTESSRLGVLLGRLPPLERLLGDYGPGRFGWVFGVVIPFPPVPCRGGQRVWNLDDSLVPAAVRERMVAAKPGHPSGEPWLWVK